MGGASSLLTRGGAFCSKWHNNIKTPGLKYTHLTAKPTTVFLANQKKKKKEAAPHTWQLATPCLYLGNCRDLPRWSDAWCAASRRCVAGRWTWLTSLWSGSGTDRKSIQCLSLFCRSQSVTHNRWNCSAYVSKQTAWLIQHIRHWMACFQHECLRDGWDEYTFGVPSVVLPVSDVFYVFLYISFSIWN